MADIESRILKVITREFHIDPDKTDFKYFLYSHPFDIFFFIAALEEEFDITIDDNKFKKCNNKDDLLSLINYSIKWRAFYKF